MEWDVKQELEQLRQGYVSASPVVRLRLIKQRLGRPEAESAAMRLVAAVCAVEALGRSLVVHAAGRPAGTADMRYRQVREMGPIELVEEVLRLYGAAEGATRYGAQVWSLFDLAQQSRDLAVHECAYLVPDQYTPLIEAAETVLGGLVEIGGLPRLVA